MKCGRVNDLISDYIDESLSATVRAEFELHVRTCEECDAKLAMMQNMVTSLRSLSGNRIPVDCWTTVQAKITKRESSWTVILRCVTRPYVAGPAFALGILLAVFIMWPSPIDDSDIGQQASAPRVRMTAASQPEFIHFIGAHNRIEHEQNYNDPDVTFIAAEMERVSPR